MAAPCSRRQTGAITLLVAIGLVVLASMTAFFSARSVLIDQLASQNHARSNQARLAAEAALASAQSALMRSPLEGDFMGDFMRTRIPCPTGWTGPEWQCSAIDTTPLPALSDASLRVVAVRNLVLSPHVVTLLASARLVGQKSQAQVRESVWVPALPQAPASASFAALVLNGCVTEAPGARVRVCALSSPTSACTGSALAPAVLSFFVPDSQVDGLISGAETLACLALSPASLQGGKASGPNNALPRSPCRRSAWQHVLGSASDAQLQAWSDAQARNGLTAHTTPPRSVYWVDSAAEWQDSVGTASHPVLLVFSAASCAVRCPHLHPLTHIVGSVVFDSGCDDEKMRGWQGGTIEGQLVVESGLPDWTAGTVLANSQAHRAFTLHWPLGMDATALQRVNGSWSAGAP
jgi:hypothetical protein